MTGNKPIMMDMKAGSYAWCACGESKKQPFCDGSHGPTGIRPVLTHLQHDQKVAWCGCKISNKKPFCDGTHSKISS